MKRVPPLLTFALVAAWLLLNGGGMGQLTLGLVLAVLLMLAVAGLRPNHPRVRHLHLVFPLVLTVLIDIVRSNMTVARFALSSARNQKMHCCFAYIPLDLRDPHGLSILAMIVTATPGTAWAGVSPDGATVRVHVLHLEDEESLIRMIKERYERPLRRIFE